MTTTRTPVRRRRRGDDITADQLQELWLGPPGPNGSLFADREALADAWARHGDRVMQMFGRHGRRPAVWWEFADLDYPGYDSERSFLYEHGLLSDDERAEMLIYWHDQFTRASAPDFCFCAGPGELLHGAEARQAHLQWADVPRSLIEQWSIAAA